MYPKPYSIYLRGTIDRKASKACRELSRVQAGPCSLLNVGLGLWVWDRVFRSKDLRFWGLGLSIEPPGLAAYLGGQEDLISRLMMWIIGLII